MSVALNEAASVPRLGFAGLGWIGGQRMQVLAESAMADIAAVCEPDSGRRNAACAALRQPPTMYESFDDLLEESLDGIVIATPNALHEPQTAAALERGIAIFCQKPLALTRAGTTRLLHIVRRMNLPLGVDWSYRYLAGVPELKRRIEAGEIGAVTAVELCFHNAYGPDAAWYYQLERAGGGCLLDLGCHLLDLCHWLLDAREPQDVRARCFNAGRRLRRPIDALEDFALADIDYASGQHVHLACSWRAAVGRGAVIGCRIFGTGGGAEIRNVDGSFYDFEVALHHGAESELLAGPPDAWQGRALLDWVQRVSDGSGCGDDLDKLETTAAVIDMIYGRTADGAKQCVY